MQRSEFRILQPTKEPQQLCTHFQRPAHNIQNVILEVDLTARFHFQIEDNDIACRVYVRKLLYYTV
jgi:hypothetical protein